MSLSPGVLGESLQGDAVASAPQDAGAFLELVSSDSVVLNGLDEAMASVRRRTARLAYLIIRREYLSAWCEACDLRRQLEQADAIAFAMLKLPDTADAARRLHYARSAADTVLRLAPTPSPAAIQQAFAPVPHADRSRWEHEVEQWMAELAAHNQRIIAGGKLHGDMPGLPPAERLIRRRSDTRPDRPVALRATSSGGATRSQRENE